MQLLPDIPLQLRMIRWSRYFVIAVAIIVFLVLIGWQFDIHQFRRPLPSLVAMNPLTAILFLASSLSFFLINARHPAPKKTQAGLSLALVVIAAAIIKLISLFFDFGWRIDRLLFPVKLDEDLIGNLVNSMAPNTAFCFVLLGICLWSMGFAKAKEKVPVQYIALAIALSAWVSILGYIYQVPSFYGLLTYIPMALHSAICFLCMSLAVLFSQPDKSIMQLLTSTFSGSVTARILIPASVLAPSLIGLLRLHGYWAGVYNTEFGVVLYTLVIIILFLALAWYSASVLNKRDIGKKETEDALRSSEEEIAAIFRAAPDAVIVIDQEGCIKRWNPEAEHLFAFTQQEVAGKKLSDTIIPDHYGQAHDKGLQRFLETGVSHIVGKTIELKALRKDRSEFDVALRISAVNINNATMFVGFIRDITEQKKTDLKLQRFNEELSRQVDEKTREITQIFERLTDGFIALDSNFNYTYMNRKAGEMTHRDPLSILGKNVWKEFPDAVGSSTYEAFHKAMRDQQPVVNTDHYEPLSLWQENHIYPTPNGLSVFIRDISQRKKAEIALRENEIKYRTLIEEAVDAILVYSPKTYRWVEANKQATKLLGYSVEEFNSMSLSDLIFPDDFLPTPFEKIEAGESVSIERKLRCKNGEGVYVESSVKKMPDGNYLAFVRDITDRKLAEQEITEARKLSDKLIDSLPGVFYFYDTNGKFIRWNTQFEKVTGYTSEEVAKMHPVQFFHEEQKEYISKRIADVFTKGMNDAEADFLTKDNRRIPYYFKAVLIDYGGQPCLLGYGIDIAERQRYEFELRASESKYKLLFESNPLPMWMLSLPDYRVIDVNNAALKQYGYTREEFLSISISEIRPVDERARFTAVTNTDFRGVHYSGIWRHQKRDGTILFVDIITHDIYYEGEPARFVLANNITEKYIAEEKLKESYEEIRNLTDHLQKIREEERTHIAREIHDELGQQLTVLKMDIAWLNKKIAPADNAMKEKLTELLSMIDTTVKTVRRIASELRPSLIDDLGLIAAMEWHAEDFEKRSGIRTEFEKPVAVDQLSDEIKIGLFRIFQESLTNVARHAKATSVKVTLVQKEENILLTIADDGVGFNEGNAVKKTLGILGMKERTLMLGGKYTITGSPGEGTKVFVSVPINGTAKKN